MANLNLDDREEHRFRADVRGYGAVIHGGPPSEREQALRNQLDGDLVVVDGQKVSDIEEFQAEVVYQATGATREEVDKLHNPLLGKQLKEHSKGLLVLEFDSMGEELQKMVAQELKGIAEERGYNEPLGYTSEDASAIVRAEPDLSGRINSYGVKVNE